MTRETNLCRACLLVLGSADSHNIFTTLNLARMFNVCTNLLPQFADELPEELCSSCYDKVHEFQEFQTMCLASDKHLREMAATSLSHVAFDDEKPVYDLAMPSTDMQITINESKLLQAEQSAEEKGQCHTRRRRGRPPKRRAGLCAQQRLQDQKLKPPVTVQPLNVYGKQTTAEQSTDEAEATESLDEARSAKGHQGGTASVHKCDICDVRFFVEHRLVAHKRSHDGLVPYPCTQPGCDRGFNRLHCLSEHLKQHEGTNACFACDQAGCDKVYKHKPTLVMHLRKYHKLGPELKTHICEICGKVFKSSAILNDHRYTHKDKSELPHACDEANCKRRFSNKEKLKVHMLRHAGIKNFVCPYCGMRKTTRNELKIHINYHTLERTWPCRYCTKVCNSAGNLKMHVRTVHERAKDYACRYCERTFGKPDTRKYHEMTHTGEKPHECVECGKRFTQPAALRTHRKIHLRQQQRVETPTQPVDDGVELAAEVTQLT